MAEDNSVPGPMGTIGNLLQTFYIVTSLAQPDRLFFFYIRTSKCKRRKSGLATRDYIVTTVQFTHDTAGNDRPSLKDLHDHVVLKVAYKWNDIAVQLLKADQGYKIKTVKADHPQDNEECCKRMFEIWLGTTSDATWNQLITALTSPCVGLDYVASQLCEYIRSIECEIYSHTAPVYNHESLSTFWYQYTVSVS